jgi:hypothetical protein
VELRGAPHMWQDSKNYSMGDGPDDGAPDGDCRRE